MIYLVNDHGGYKYKEALKNNLTKKGIRYKDMGAQNEVRSDMIDFVVPAVKDFLKNKGEYMVLICRSGAASAIVANRFKGMRAVVCHSPKIALMAKSHNNVNALCFGADHISKNRMFKNLSIVLKTAFLGDRYQLRNDKVDSLKTE